jgi:DNA-binding NtrC family response regulator
LAEHFLSLYAAKFGRALSGFAEEAWQALQAYRWPGNVRELRNVIERAAALTHGSTIVLEDLPIHIGPTAESAPIITAEMPSASIAPLAPTPQTRCVATEQGTLAQTKHEAEFSRIVQALAKHGNNRQRAAAELGISRMTLYNKMHRYGMIGAT